MDDNILVAVRVRPLIARENEKNEQKLWEVKNSKYIYRANQKSSPSKVFCFDRVFDTEQSTVKIYNDVCLPIVNSTMQGFNGTIFAYGQTSSGKTYTMMGEYDKKNKYFEKHRGIIHYCIEDIFSYIQEMPDREFLLRVSFLEIYNEKVYDLLSSKNEDLKLLEDGYGNIKVSGLEEKIVQTTDQIWKWMGIGQNKRRTGETQMNRVSSRSHSIFRMIIESRLKDQDVVNVSQLNLVDLAGSENLKQTNKGERFQEGVHINLSLSTLCQVIRQLSEKDFQFINYRNSKLTRLLQTSLGGNARTAIICAVTPASVKETLSTLDFAQRAKKIQNKPMKNEIVTDQALLKQYANKIKKLAMELEASKEQGKELEEKTKQNENLKRQIEALKANFVSQTVKSSRRETWGGLRDTRRFQQLECFSFKHPSCTDFDLPTLEEDFEGELDATSFSINRVFQQRDSLKPKILNKKVSDAETQTESENEKSDNEKPGTVGPESNPLLTSTTLQTELDELKEYTTLEFQYLKAGNELQAEIENLKQENITLKKRLNLIMSESPRLNSDSLNQENVFLPDNDNYQADAFKKVLIPKESQTSPLKFEAIKKHSQDKDSESEVNKPDFSDNLIDFNNSIDTKMDAQSEWEAKLLVMSKELEIKYEKELAEVRHKLAETESKLCDLKSFEERNKKLEDCNRNLEQKLTQLEASYSEQVKELELKHEKELAELKYMLSESESNRQNNLKLLEEKSSELEECNRDFKQKITQLETSHSAYVNELEKKYDRKLEEISDQLTEFENDKLSNLKFLEDKNKELEECNKDLKQNIIQLEDSYSIQVKELEAKYKKELEEIKQQLTETQCDKLNNLKLFEDKNRELEECNKGLRENVIQLQDSHHTQAIELKVKYEKELEKIKQQLIETENDKQIVQSELNFKLLEIKELEKKYQKELHDVKLQMNDPEGYTLSELPHLQEKCKELEQCNKDLNKKLYDLEASHHAKVKAVEVKFENSESELLLKINNLESDIMKLSEIKNQLQKKCSELEEYNSNLNQKIADLESSHVAKIKVLEENFETERSEWNAKTRALVKDMDAKHEQELTDLENDVTKDLMEIFNKRIQVCIKEASEIKEELEKIKLQNVELIKIKEQHLKRIKELEDLVGTVSSDKETEIVRLNKENNKELIDLKAKYEKMIIEYRSKVRKCADCYKQLQIQAQFYMEENERIKNQISSDTQLKEKVNSLINEKDVLLKKHAAAELEIKNLKESLENLKRPVKHISNSKELEDHNKILRLDLDQKKAKIICLETNNANLVQEINKLKDKAALKDGSCKCKMNIKALKVETPLNNESAKENSDKKMVEEKTHTEFQQIHKPMQSDDFKKEKDSQDKGKVEQNDPYLHHGDSATHIRCQFLEGKLYKKDKEIRMLKEKCADLNSELIKIKNCPIISSENKPEVRKSEVVKSEVKKTPVSALRERNEEVTSPVNTPPKNQGGIRNVYERLNLKHHRRKSYKPYLPPLNAGNSENHPQEIIGQLKEEKREIKQSAQQGNNVASVLYGEPECKQQ